MPQINEFKYCKIIRSTLREKTFSNQAKCLMNVPQNLPNETEWTYQNNYAGQIYSPDDQCKMIFGNNATFCRVFIFLII